MSAVRAMEAIIPATLKRRRQARIWPSVSLRPLFAMLIAFAMLFAPLVTAGGSAMAMAPSDHHAQMMKTGHCGEQPVKKGGVVGAKSCCVAMCAAIAITSDVVVEPHQYAQVAERPSLAESPHSFLARLPTPPPRAA